MFCLTPLEKSNLKAIILSLLYEFQISSGVQNQGEANWYLSYWSHSLQISKNFLCQHIYHQYSRHVNICCKSLLMLTIIFK